MADSRGQISRCHIDLHHLNVELVVGNMLAYVFDKKQNVLDVDKQDIMPMLAQNQ